MSNKNEKKPDTTEERESGMDRRNATFRRIMAWVMLVFFILLIANILVFHQMIIESSILYMALVAVFFLGNGARGGARDYVGQEQGDAGEEPEPGVGREVGEGSESGSKPEPGQERDSGEA